MKCGAKDLTRRMMEVDLRSERRGFYSGNIPLQGELPSATSPNLFDYPHDYPIGKCSFTLPGLGRAGDKCCHYRLTHIGVDDTEEKHLKFSLLRCKRIECPKCWRHWERLTVFEIALAIEGYARLHGKRPITFVGSVPPEKVKDKWTWERVNTSLFRRCYRRAKNVGVEGGVAIFHPYRLKNNWKFYFSKLGVKEENGGYWKAIRTWLSEGKLEVPTKNGVRVIKKKHTLHDFVKLGPHIHIVGFGDVKEHECEDFVIKFIDEDDKPVPKELTLKDVVAFARYLVTHIGVLNHKKKYGDTVRTQIVKTIRWFGALNGFEPRRDLPPDMLNQLATEIAEMLGMVWDAEKQEPVYPASVRETRQDAEERPEPEWIEIWRLGELLSDEQWLSSLSLSQQQFFFEIWRKMTQKRRLLWYEEVGKPPPDVKFWFEAEPPEDEADTVPTPRYRDSVIFRVMLGEDVKIPVNDKASLDIITERILNGYDKNE